MRYDPAVSPDPTEWLALDEGEQIALVEDYHRHAGTNQAHATLHAAIHAVIERQLPEQLAPVTIAFERLRGEGLDRHDAVHALGAVLAEHMRRLMTGEFDSQDPNTSYFADLDRLTVASWRSEFGLGDH